VGWFWFLGTLVPVIGFIQVGAQSRADRYMYIPSVGLSIALIWGIDALFQLGGRRRKEAEVLSPDAGGSTSLPRPQPFWKFIDWCSSRRAQFLVPASAIVLAACLFCTRIQAGYWHDSETLFRHAIELAPDNYMAYNSLGRALDQLDRKDEAIQCLREAVRLAPGYSGGQYNLGTMLLLQNKIEEAMSHLNVAVKESPKDPNGHHNLGHAYLLQGKLPEAITEYAESVALDPENAPFRIVLGMALLKQSRWTDAEIILVEAVRLDPANAEANRYLGLALLNQGKTSEAIRYLSQAVRLQPANSDARFDFGLALSAQNQPAQAADQFAQYLRLCPTEGKGHYALATALSKLHNVKDAIFHYREALRLTPDYPEALNELARLLACAPDDSLRDGVEAVKLAEKACALTNNKEAAMLMTLAAAYAEAGRFPDAIAAAQRARELAVSNGENPLAAKAGELLELCQSGRPLRE
jgi:Flp pilus assembly protein TadD